MDNNCLLVGNELASFVGKIARLKSSGENSKFEKHLLENDDISRSVSYVSFFDEYDDRSAEFADRLFYVLDGSGRFDFKRDQIRYIAGDIVSSRAGESWSFVSDKSGTKLIEVSVLKKEKNFGENAVENDGRQMC